MKKKMITGIIIALVLLPFLEGLLSASSIWKTSASNDETEDVIKNDNLLLTQTLQENETGPYIQIKYQKRPHQPDETLRLHFLVADEENKNIDLEAANNFGKTPEGWYSEQQLKEEGTFKIPITAGKRYYLATRLVAETPAATGENETAQSSGEVVENPLLSEKEQAKKELIFVPKKDELDLTDLRNANDKQTLIQIKGLKVSYTNTLKDNGAKADWQVTFTKAFSENQKYKIRYQILNPNNKANISKDNVTEDKGNYREEKNANPTSNFTAEFGTDTKQMKISVWLVDEAKKETQLLDKQVVTAEETRASGGAGSNSSQATSTRQIGAENSPTSADGLSYAKTVYDDEPSARLTTLRAAGLFHVFAKKIDLGQHLNGNFAAPIANVRTNTGAGSANELYYAGTLGSGFNGVSKSLPEHLPGKFILGPSITYEKENDGRIKLNGMGPHVYKNISFERESSIPYINFEEEFAYLENLNRDIATWEPDIVVDKAFFTDNNNQIHEQKIDLTKAPYDNMESIVIKIAPSAHEVQRKLTIKGLEPDHSGKVRNVYFNVEIPAGTKDFNYKQEIELQDSDGQKINTGEHSVFTKSPVLYNFYSAGSDALYKENINIGAIIQGAIVAPGATGKASTTVEGNLIFSEWNGGTETHKWDYKPKGSVTIIKQDPVEDEYLGGAEFDLYVIEQDKHVKINPDGQPYKTDAQGRLTVSGLSQGYQYYFVEITPPKDNNGQSYPAYTDKIYFKITPGTATTTTYHPVYNVKAQAEFKFGAKKLLKDTVDKETNFLFEVQKIVEGTATATAAYGKVTYTKNDGSNTEKVIKFYPSAGDRDSEKNEIGDSDWEKILEDGANYQLVETSTHGYNVKYSGYGGEGNNKFTANFAKDKAVHINFLVTNYEDEFTIKGKKEVSEAVAADKTFKFEIKEKLTDNILAFGKAEVKKGEKTATIKFYKDENYQISISGNDWFAIVNPDKTYVIVETEKQGYNASYNVNDVATDEIKFVAGAVNNIGLVVKNSKDKEPPKINLTGSKKVTGENLEESKTFNFELRKQDGNKQATTDPIIANGEAIVSEKNNPAPIVFTDPNNNNAEITTKDQWTALLGEGSYYIVETNSEGYKVVYTIRGNSDESQGNSFDIPAQYNEDITINFTAENTKEDIFEFEAEKKLTGNVPLPNGGKEFEFEIQTLDTNKPVAYGSVSVSAKDIKTKIRFTDTTPARNTITDWTKILADGKEYQLVETTTGYHVRYLDAKSKPINNTFTVNYGESEKMYFLVHNELDVGDLPSTGGSGIVKFMQLALVILLIGGLIGGYYWYRNKQVK